MKHQTVLIVVGIGIAVVLALLIMLLFGEAQLLKTQSAKPENPITPNPLPFSSFSPTTGVSLPQGLFGPTAGTTTPYEPIPGIRTYEECLEQIPYDPAYCASLFGR